MALVAPSNLTATPASASKVNLAWTNAQAYDDIYVYRSVSGGAYSQIAVLIASATSYADNTVQDGKVYSYKLYCTREDPPEAGWSNVASATTPLPAPSGLSGYSNGAGTQAVLSWVDNSQNETGFQVYKNGTLIYTTAANATGYTATGLTPGATYTFKIKATNAVTTSSASNEFSLLMADPPAAPSGLTVNAIGTTKARLNWLDNSDNEQDFHIERSATSATAGFSQIATVGAGVKTYEDTGLTSNTQYWYRVRAHNASGYSSYCAVATATTWAAIAQPTNLVAVAISGTVVDLYFQDNSELEDSHRLERKTGSGGTYAEVATLEPNRNAYRDTGLSAGQEYYYRVRAKQGSSSYSSYSDAVAVTTLSAPTAPSDLAVLEYQDTTVKLGWTVGTGQVGFKIEQSATGAWAGEEVEVAVLPCATLAEYTVRGLSASTTYYFRIRAYNAVGNSSYATAVSQATRATYQRSAFERLISRNDPTLVYLVEVNPMMALQGWALASGKTYAYELDFNERGAVITQLQENGVALTAVANLTAVESTAGSWWHDTTNRKVYVHTTGGDATTNYILTGSFWIYLTNWQQGSTVYNGNFYQPYVAADGIPDTKQEVARFYSGSFVIDAGSVSFSNPIIGGVGYWDRLVERYLFDGAKVRVLAGGEGFAYADFQSITTGIVTDLQVTDQRFTLTLRDLRDGLHRTLPTARYSLDEFAALDENMVDRVKPFGYGAITNAVPVCIDTTNRIFEFHAGRAKSVEAVRKNGTTLTAGTDYFIDYQRGRIILARGLSYSDDDVISADFTGQVMGDDTAISRAGDIFRDALTRFLGLTDGDLDLASTMRLRNDDTTALSLYLWKETDSQELIRRVERSVQASTFQAAGCKLGIKAALTTAPSDVRYIPDGSIFSFSMKRSRADVYSRVEVYYGEDSSTDTFAMYSLDIPAAVYKRKTQQTLSVYTALASASDAATLASAIVAQLMKPTLEFTVPAGLFAALPGDLVYLSRGRYFDASGTASNKLLRMLSLSKQQSTKRTTVVAEEV